MKQLVIILIASMTVCLFGTLHAQSRTAGRMVVPIGYESYDSLRFGLWGADNYALPITDSVHCTYDFFLGGINETVPLGAMKGVAGEYSPLHSTITYVKQRVFWGVPPYHFDSLPPAFYWLYNDANGINPHAIFHNNAYDSTDISPYAEYPKSDSIVTAKFHTLRYNDSDSLVAYGNEGRVIAGYNDARVLNGSGPGLNWTLLNNVYPTWRDAYWWNGNNSQPTNASVYTEIVDARLYPNLSAYRKHVHSVAGYAIDTSTMVIEASGPIADTAKMFSTTLEFAVDTTSIDTALANGRSIDSLPLARFQVVYKMGDTADNFGHERDGWPVLPFVPFKDAAHPSNHGWYKVVDTTITLAIYRQLDNDWRWEDTLENGSPSHNWHFKQLHIMLTNMPAPMSKLISNVDPNPDTTWANIDDANSYHRDRIYTHPDSLVGLDTTTNLGNAHSHLLEMRALSTYRATVYLRDMTYQDTNVDKYLYRKRDTAFYSCTPLELKVDSTTV